MQIRIKWASYNADPCGFGYKTLGRVASSSLYLWHILGSVLLEGAEFGPLLVDNLIKPGGRVLVAGYGDAVVLQ